MRSIYTILAILCFGFIAEGNHKKGVKSGTFEKVIGGASYDAGNTAVQLKDGSFLVAGKSSSFSSSSDGLVIKLSASGSEVWQKTFGDDENDEINDIIEASDGSYVFVGQSDSYNYTPDMNDFWAVKVNASGEEVWNVTFASEETIDVANAVIETEDGGFLLVGTSTAITEGAVSNIKTVKINKEGEVVWEKHFGGEMNEQGSSVAKSDDGFLILGNSETFGEGRWDMWVVKIDKEGNKLWEAAYGGKNNEMGNNIIATSDGGFVLAGYSYSFAVASLDAWVVKIDKDGRQVWAGNFGGLSTDEAFGVVELADGSLVMGGYTDVYEPNEDFENISADKHNVFVVKMDSQGKKIWESTIGGTGNQKAFDFIGTLDGGFMAVGNTDAIAPNGMDILVYKLDGNGKK